MENRFINEFELDQLKESINIGASHASNALSQMIQKQVMLSVPKVNFGDSVTIPLFIGDASKDVTAIKVRIQEPTAGVMFYLFPDGNDIKLLKIINKNRPNRMDLTNEDLSILSEVGNILSGSFLTAISKFLGTNFIHSISEIKINNLEKIVRSATDDVTRQDPNIMILRINMEIKEDNIETNLFFLMDPNFTKVILELSQKILGALEPK